MKISPIPAPLVFDVNDHMIGFYLGRDVTPASPVAHVEDSWVNYRACAFGVCNYEIYKEDQAIIHDTAT